MNRLARILVVISVVALVAVLCGCGGSSGSAGPSVVTQGKPPPPPPLPPDPSGWVYVAGGQCYRVKWDASVRETVHSMIEVSHVAATPFIVYTRDIDPGSHNVPNLFVSRMDGSDERNIVADGDRWRTGGAVLTDDDTKVAIVACRWDPVNYTSSDDGIYVADLVYDLSGLPQPIDMDAATRVTFPPGGQAGPVWSPDKQMIAYEQWPYGTGLKAEIDLYVVEVASKTTRLLVHTDSSMSSPKPDWSPDGARIAFTREIRASNGPMKAKEIWTVRPDGTDLRAAITRANTSFSYQERPSWSPDGNWIAARIYPGTPSSTENYIVRSPANGSGTAVRLSTTDNGISEVIWRP